MQCKRHICLLPHLLSLEEERRGRGRQICSDSQRHEKSSNSRVSDAEKMVVGSVRSRRTAGLSSIKVVVQCTEIGIMAWLFAKLQPGRARKTQSFSQALYWAGIYYFPSVAWI